MAAAGRTRSRDIKLQHYAFNTPSISIYMSSMASIQIGIGVRPARLASIQIGITSIASIQIGIRPRVAAVERIRLSNIKLSLSVGQNRRSRQYTSSTTPLQRRRSYDTTRRAYQLS